VSESVFGYDKFSSVSAMLMDLGLPSCNTIMLNAKTIFVSRLRACPNKYVQLFNINVSFDFTVMCACVLGIQGVFVCVWVVDVLWTLVV